MIIVSPYESISVLIVFIDTFEQMLQRSYCTDSETVLFSLLKSIISENMYSMKSVALGAKVSRVLGL